MPQISGLRRDAHDPPISDRARTSLEIKYYTNTMDIETRKLNIERQIVEAAEDCGRNPGEIRLLAVSKTQPVDVIRQLATLRQREFGENYLQEASEKIPQLADQKITWHFIGQLQRNKTRTVAELFDWVQSVDRLVIAERLSAQRPGQLSDLNICLQVSMSDEPGKGGRAAGRSNGRCGKYTVASAPAFAGP